MGRRRDYGPVRVLPTPTFFYGMQPGEEVLVELEPGKTLVTSGQVAGGGVWNDRYQNYLFPQVQAAAPKASSV